MRQPALFAHLSTQDSEVINMVLQDCAPEAAFTLERCQETGTPYLTDRAELIGWLNHFFLNGPNPLTGEVEPVIRCTVVGMRPMTGEELNFECWDDNPYPGRRAPMAIELDSGMVIYPSQDEEGNGPGELFGKHDGKGMRFA